MWIRLHLSSFSRDSRKNSVDGDRTKLTLCLDNKIILKRFHFKVKTSIFGKLTCKYQ
jgi:hypothetical protein